MNSDRIHQFLLALILISFVLLATIYSVITPIFEASDELWHYPMVKYLADHHFGLPYQQPGLTDEQAPWRQEGSQPPLYYMLGAALTAWINTDDMPEVRQINPHADIGTVVPDNNANMILHNTAREEFPWSGTVLAVHLVRFLSIALATGTLLATYQLARELFPPTPIIALGAAAFTAFNPMFVFISAVINNDNLATLLATVLLLMIVRLLKRPDLPPRRTYVWIGLVAGAGMLAKFQIGFLLLLIALALLITTLRQRDWRPLIIGGLISGGLTILIAGWWYWRNYDLYGDFTGINRFLDVVGRRSPPADLAQLWTERETFMMSYWGLFGGINVPLSDAAYAIFNLLTLIGLAGLVSALLRALLPLARPGFRESASITDRHAVNDMATQEKDRQRPWILPQRAGSQAEKGARFSVLSWLNSPVLQRRVIGATPKLALVRAIVVIWPFVVFASLISWTRQTSASQGRLMFSALASLNIVFAFGLASWFRTNTTRRITLIGGTALIFAGLALAAPFTTIRPVYTLDHEATWTHHALDTGALTTACFREPTTPDQDTICMAANTLEGTLLPGEYLKFSPTFTVKHEMTRNWSIFVHLVNENGTIEAQRDVYPGGGLIATSTIAPGDTWNNPIAVKLIPGLYTPQTLRVYIGLYDYHTYDRMIPLSDDVDDQNRVYIGQFTLVTPPGNVPNPVDVNFDNKLMLRGYEVSARAINPGEATDITLYWAARQNDLADYAISYQIIDPVSYTKAAQNDSSPTPPTSEWTSGDAITDTRTLIIAPNAAPGRYRLLIRVYPVDAAGAGAPLRIRTGTGGQSEDFVWLSWIQVN